MAIRDFCGLVPGPASFESEVGPPLAPLPLSQLLAGSAATRDHACALLSMLARKASTSGRAQLAARVLEDCGLAPEAGVHVVSALHACDAAFVASGAIPALCECITGKKLSAESASLASAVVARLSRREDISEADLNALNAQALGLALVDLLWASPQAAELIVEHCAFSDRRRDRVWGELVQKVMAGLAGFYAEAMARMLSVYDDDDDAAKGASARAALLNHAFAATAPLPDPESDAPALEERAATLVDARRATRLVTALAVDAGARLTGKWSTAVRWALVGANPLNPWAGPLASTAVASEARFAALCAMVAPADVDFARRVCGASVADVQLLVIAAGSNLVNGAYQFVEDGCWQGEDGCVLVRTKEGWAVGVNSGRELVEYYTAAASAATLVPPATTEWRCSHRGVFPAPRVQKVLAGRAEFVASGVV